jgi:hypothetical protein
VHGGERDVATDLDELLRNWPPDCAFSAQTVLRKHPHFGQDRSAVIAIAAEEYLRARTTDQGLNISSFAAGFGELEASVLRAAEVMEFFLANRQDRDDLGSSVWPSAGDRFLHFDLLEQLGGGLLSRVFVARDNAVAGRHVVVKLTPSTDREIRALGRISHPGIVPILSIETDDAVTGLSAVVMPFQSRVTLYDIIDVLSSADGVGRRDIPVDQIGLEIHGQHRAPVPPALAWSSVCQIARAFRMDC